MSRYFSALLLPAVLLLASAPVVAQWRVQPRSHIHDGLPGAYVNASGGGDCFVHSLGSAYAFVNENGSEAIFEFVGPRSLRQVSGQWDPSVVATLTRDRWGRTMIRFDSAHAPPGYWVKAY
jgi:hypothetical protein